MWWVDKLGPAPRPTPPVSGATPYETLNAQTGAGARPQPSAATPAPRAPTAAPAQRQQQAAAKAAPPPSEPKKEKKKGWF